MKKLLILTLLLIIGLSKAQQFGNKKDWVIVALIACTRIEITSIDEKAFFSFGTKYPLTDKDYVGLRGHFNWWDLPERQFIVIPELDYFRVIKSFEKDKEIVRRIYLGAGVTPNAVSPKLGINFYYFLTAEVGYNFEYNTYKHFPTKGFRYSFGINIIF